MDNSSGTSRDSRAAGTANGSRYADPNARLCLNPDGLPVAFRRVQCLRPGTFAGASHLQLVTPRGVTPISEQDYRAYLQRCTPPN